MKNKHLKSVSLNLSGNHFNQAIEQLSRALGQFDGRPARKAGEFAWSADIYASGGLMLVSATCEGECDFWTVDDTPEMLIMLRCRQGATQTMLRGKAVESSGGSLLLANNIEVGRCALRGDTIASDTLLIDWKIIARTAASLFDRPINDALDLTPEIERSNPNLFWIANMIDNISEGMRANGPLLRSPLAATHMVEALANLVITGVPNRLTQFMDTRPAAVAPRQVKQAIDFMHEHIGQPLTVQSVAQAVGVSSRSLELSFRSFKGTTPAAYLRDTRLKAAHAELSDPESPLSIKEVCLKWGFFHFGRFSAIYRAAYGASPSQTKSSAGAKSPWSTKETD